MTIDDVVALAMAAVIMVLLTGCQAVPALPETVLVPTPVPCVAELPKKPAFPSDAELRALDDFKLPLALAIERRFRQDYEAELEAALKGCTFNPDGI